MAEVITDNLDLWTSALLTKSTAGRGSNGKLEAYGIKKLRELILELAVRGKLVQQDPNDEPASVLLANIAKEKARLIKEGKIKQEKPLTEVDAMPYELPANWGWARLPSIASYKPGKTPSTKNPSYWSDNSADVPWVISASAGFSSWKDHLRRQGKTAHIASERIEVLLAGGAYETVLEEIESARGREVFIQEIRDEFSRNLTIPDVVWRISELFTDTVITTNYDRLLEQSFETGEADRVQVINGLNALEQRNPKKITVIKLHGDIREPKRCILSKNQYDEAYGNGELNMHKPIPKLLAYHYKNSSLLFLGCSLSNDRTVQVFRKIREGMGEEEETKQHFAIEQAPESLEEIAQRNAELVKLGITPIWFEKGRYELVESILSLAKNELRHRGVAPQSLPLDEPPIKLDMDLSHFLGDFIDLMPLLHWLHRAVPQAATRKYLSAMQRVFHGHSFATRQTDENLRMALDRLLRVLSNSAAYDGYSHGKLSVAFKCLQQYLKSIGEENHLDDDFGWNIRELLTIPALQLEPLVANKIDGSFDYHAIRLISALLQHGKNQHASQKSFCEMPGAVNHEFGDYISLALSENLGVTVPDRLDQIYTGDLRNLCEDAWNNLDKPIDLRFFEQVKLMFAHILK